ncbi:MAG TPA: SDR family oxidoreductase [Solirubrobacteraceae bacterium]|jgi:thioester reductase-like protein|nr:SDR family oxidoreductase [Solirubrobacteraceae bacterium]
MTTSGDVLLTGATGFVGMELLARYLQRGDRGVVALVRAQSHEGAQARIDGVLENLFGADAPAYRPRVRAVAADMTAPGLGLSEAERAEVIERVTKIIHSAASVSFALELKEARAINLEGTRRMLELAELAQERGRLECYAHISTAFVAGNHPGSFSEGDADVGQSFHNSYEQSKFEAEQLVRAQDGLPYTILRPSIVVGDRNNGWTAAFNVLYWPMRAFARGLFTAVPAIPSAAVDVVSIDYVADAAYQLCETSCGTGATYHLTAGEHASTIAELAGLASRYFRRPVPRVVPPAEFAEMTLGSAERKALEASSEYFPYFCMEGTFDDREARKRLEPDGITTAPLRDYVDRLLDFATRSRWGKRPISRAAAYAAAAAAYPLPLRAAS